MLCARDISFAHPGQTRLLYDGFSLDVGEGERLALIGPSGTGKTTLCRLLAGFLQPSRGEVLVDGKPLDARGAREVQLIGQHPELAVDPRLRMEATLKEAGGLQPDLLEALGIRREWMKRYPHELSGGELQRFCIARALAVKPRYLIADEVTTMLDAVTQAQIWAFLLEWQALTGSGMVVVTHSRALLDRIATRSVTVAPAE